MFMLLIPCFRCFLLKCSVSLSFLFFDFFVCVCFFSFLCLCIFRFHLQRSEERSVQLAVRVHRTLELADDKFYVITCGKAGFNRDDNSVVVLKFLDNQRRVRETVYGREYTIKAELTQPNGTHGIKVKNCFAFNRKNASIPLIDNRG